MQLPLQLHVSWLAGPAAAHLWHDRLPSGPEVRFSQRLPPLFPPAGGQPQRPGAASPCILEHSRKGWTMWRLDCGEKTHQMRQTNQMQQSRAAPQRRAADGQAGDQRTAAACQIMCDAGRSPSDHPGLGYLCLQPDQVSIIKHHASSIRHQASSIKHQASSIKHPPACSTNRCTGRGTARRTGAATAHTHGKPTCKLKGHIRAHRAPFCLRLTNPWIWPPHLSHAQSLHAGRGL